MSKNIANTVSDLAERMRVPFNTPQSKFGDVEIPGYVTHWFKGEPGRLQRAMRAGYEFVKPEEIEQYNFDLAGDLTEAGHSDLGDRVSIPAQSGVGENGQYLRLYLMKLKVEFRKQDQRQYEIDRIDPIVQAITGGKIGAGEAGETPGDVKVRYQKPFKLPEMFTKKR
jgi:hypothetical protein